jgi:hypothetical protein
LEVLVLGVGKNVIEKASESNYQLSSQTTNHKDTILLGLWISDIVDLCG